VPEGFVVDRGEPASASRPKSRTEKRLDAKHLSVLAALAPWRFKRPGLGIDFPQKVLDLRIKPHLAVPDNARRTRQPGASSKVPATRSAR
jgi:hypothetical protein